MRMAHWDRCSRLAVPADGPGLQPGVRQTCCASAPRVTHTDQPHRRLQRIAAGSCRRGWRCEILSDRRIRAAGELGALVNESLDAARVQESLPDTISLSRGLRTPLNTIVGYSELLQEDADAGGYTALLPDLQRIRTASRHLLGQAHAMLDLVVDAVPDCAPTFKSTVPVAPDPVIQATTHAPRDGSDPATMTLLVVDDDEANRDMLSRGWERLGYRVAVAQDGREARQWSPTSRLT